MVVRLPILGRAPTPGTVYKGSAWYRRKSSEEGIPSGHFWKSVATWLATVLQLALDCLGLTFAFFNPCLQKAHE